MIFRIKSNKTYPTEQLTKQKGLKQYKSMKIGRLSILALICALASTNCVEAARSYPEKSYQNAWCKANNGQSEVVLFDRARVDCVTADYAIEFDFADKWGEAVGQSLYYGAITKKKPGIVLIMENGDNDKKYLSRLNTVSQNHGITVWTMSPTYFKKVCK